jgi:hypothetical protein
VVLAFLLGGMEFGPRALHLLVRNSTISATSQPFCTLVISQVWAPIFSQGKPQIVILLLPYLCRWALTFYIGLPQTAILWASIFWIAGITDITHHDWSKG